MDHGQGCSGKGSYADALPVFIITCVVARFTFFLKPAHDILLVQVELVALLETGVELNGALENSWASFDNVDEEEQAVDGIRVIPAGVSRRQPIDPLLLDHLNFRQSCTHVAQFGFGCR